MIAVSHGFDKGKHLYRVKGGRFAAHGVPLYIEIARALGFDFEKDPNVIPLGENAINTLPQFPKRVTIELEAGKPRRVTGAA